jgi:hypothetical protein
MVKEALEDLRSRDLVDVSISSVSYGFEATKGLFSELQKVARPLLEVEQETFGSYFTFTRASKDVEC